MEPRGGVGEFSGARVGSTPTPAPKAKRKKARPSTLPSGSQPLPARPIPQPYLARAPKPISSYSSTSLDHQLPASSNLVLPSSYRRPPVNGDAGPSTARNRERERFANGLMAPPAIRAGANSRNRPVSPNAAAAAPTGGNGRRRQADRAVRGLGAGNPSMTSLGHLGRILEADPTVAPVAEEGEAPGTQLANPPSSRRRRRIVRGDESPGVARRLTVSSREEGHLPENTDAPPPFPFPTTSTARLPPTFQSTEPSLPPIPSSPPPTFEQATGLAPLAPPLLTLDEREGEVETVRPSSRASTRYMSAPSSPVLTAVESVEDGGEMSEDERSDRRMWNADLLAGYTLEERVQREMNRKQARDGATERDRPAEPPTGTGEPADRPAADAELASASAATVTEIATTEPLDRVQTPIAEEVDVPSENGGNEQSRSSPPPQEGDDDNQVEHAAVVEAPTASATPTPMGIPSRPSPQSETPLESPAQFTDNQASPTDHLSRSPPAAASPDPIREEIKAEEIPEVLPPVASSTPTERQTQSPGRKADRSLEPTTEAKNAPSSTARMPTVAQLPLPIVAPFPTKSVPVKDGPIAPEAHPKPGEMEPISNRSLPTLSETTENPDAADDSTVFGNPGPSRKLTRGKAIRRSSSGLIKPSESPTASVPLFSAARFDFGKFTPSSPPLEAPRPFIHRSSAPEIPLAQPQPIARKARLSEDRSFALIGGRRLGDAPPPQQAKNADQANSEKAVIPPHREAALLRRESILAQLTRPAPAPAPVPIAKTTRSNPASPRMSDKRASLPSGPLIDFSEEDPVGYAPSSPGASSQGFQALASTNAELLQLLEEEAGQPESSSQAAAKAALVKDIQAQLAEQQQEENVPAKTDEAVSGPPTLPPRPADLQETIKKKKAPPPPPPLRNRKGTAWTAGQKISIVDTATSPITPRPSLRRPANPQPEPSPTAPRISNPAPPPLPTRRPPPPPPPTTGAESDLTSSPSHTSSPPPPVFTRGDRPISSFSGTSDTSSIYDKPPPSNPPPVPPAPWKRFDRSPYRPRGPRPRPPPPPPRPRTWAKVVSDTVSRPTAERMHSAGELAVQTRDLGDEDRDRDSSLTVRSPTRSVSEQDLLTASRARRVTPRSPEYTDLDVYISRLEGSGREYEGYSHIAQFLGPAKSPAASQDALNTLLPGPVIVESRRTTKDGKVKLKLSLLGVRVTKCPICLAQFREKEMGVLLPVCGHLGHEECARRWFREDDRCFVCRIKLRSAEGVV